MENLLKFHDDQVIFLKNRATTELVELSTIFR